MRGEGWAARAVGNAMYPFLGLAPISPLYGLCSGKCASSNSATQSANGLEGSFSVVFLLKRRGLSVTLWRVFSRQSMFSGAGVKRFAWGLEVLRGFVFCGCRFLVLRLLDLRLFSL